MVSHQTADSLPPHSCPLIPTSSDTSGWHPNMCPRPQPSPPPSISQQKGAPPRPKKKCQERVRQTGVKPRLFLRPVSRGGDDPTSGAEKGRWLTPCPPPPPVAMLNWERPRVWFVLVSFGSVLVWFGSGWVESSWGWPRFRMPSVQRHLMWGQAAGGVWAVGAPGRPVNPWRKGLSLYVLSV